MGVFPPIAGAAQIQLPDRYVGIPVKVEQGDTIWSILKMFQSMNSDVDWAMLLKEAKNFNDVGDADNKNGYPLIRPGDVLVVPMPKLAKHFQTVRRQIMAEGLANWKVSGALDAEPEGASAAPAAAGSILAKYAWPIAAAVLGVPLLLVGIVLATRFGWRPSTHTPEPSLDGPDGMPDNRSAGEHGGNAMPIGQHATAG